MSGICQAVYLLGIDPKRDDILPRSRILYKKNFHIQILNSFENTKTLLFEKDSGIEKGVKRHHALGLLGAKCTRQFFCLHALITISQ